VVSATSSAEGRDPVQGCVRREFGRYRVAHRERLGIHRRHSRVDARKPSVALHASPNSSDVDHDALESEPPSASRCLWRDSQRTGTRRCGMSLLPSTRIVRAFASVPLEAFRLIVDRETRTADDRLAVPLPSIERSRPRRGSPFEPAVDPIIGAPAWPAWRRANCVRPSDQRPVERVAEYYHDMPCPEPSRERWLALGAISPAAS